MNSVLLIKTKGVKDLLSLFDPESVIESVSLGDTWHPSAGFIDESIIEHLERVKDILDCVYDFPGLVSFEATVEHMNIRLIGHSDSDQGDEIYEISGSNVALRGVQNKIIEHNATNLGKYQITKSQSHD
jgi:hypothetical protein